MRRPIRYLSVALIVVVTILIANSLDRLPSSIRSQIDTDRTALAAAQQHVRAGHDQVASQIQSDPALFNSLPFAQQWSGRFDQATAVLSSASFDIDELTRIEKRNRHSETSHAQSLIAAERNLRTRALADADAIVEDAAHWVDAKNHLPQQLEEMDRNYRAIHSFDLAALATAVTRAETDWPAKKPDLDARLEAQRAAVAHADQLWQATADDRRQASAGNLSSVNAGALLAASDSLSTAAADQPKQAQQLQTLTGQLYNSWDKLLVDMQARGDGSAREYDQKVRTVKTHLTDVAAKTGETTSDEQWVIVSKPTFDAMRNDLGMAIEHKSAGQYDSEAEHTAQPAGLAYVAPPSQGSNQYGYWDHRDGRDFWVFYGQYALMRDLLFNHDYRPYDRYEWEDYRTSHSRGQTYYGHDSDTGAPKYGSQGSTTQNRYSGSKYAQSGGFRDSQYASKPGGYKSSPYSSPSQAPKSFGQHSSPQSAPPRGFRPAPTPSRPPMRSPGRTFGRRH